MSVFESEDKHSAVVRSASTRVALYNHGTVSANFAEVSACPSP
jgi:hypothetical protein